MPVLPHQQQRSNQDMIISYLTARKAVGFLGFFFPAVLSLGALIIGNCHCLRDSVSSYYYTIMVSYFAGTLCVVALFLFAYKGYDTVDQVSSNAGAVFALGIVFCPTNVTNVCTCCNIFAGPPNAFLNTAHYLSAGLFFVTMAYISLFQFTKTDPALQPTRQKQQRNKVYRTCAFIMIVAMSLIPTLKIQAVLNAVGKYKPEFWLEATVLMAFGVSWLIKGETLLKDK